MNKIRIVIIGFVGLLALFCGRNNTENNQDKLNNAEVVLRCIKVGQSTSADKYRWEKVKIIKIIKNNSKEKISGEISVASLSFEKGIPDEECTIYLEKYNQDNNSNWRLLGGKAETGISNIKNNEKDK